MSQGQRRVGDVLRAPGRRVGDKLDAPARRVLLALHDPVAAGRLAKRFSEQRIVPTLAFSCDELIQEVRDHSYALLVIDEAFVCGHDSSCLNKVRAISAAPIMAVAEVDEEEYPELEIALPPQVGTSTVAARGEALIEMSRPVPLPEPIRWGHLELDLRTHQAHWSGSSLALTNLQFRILEVLVLAAGGVVTTDQLSRRVWGDSSFDDGERLVAHIRRIRKLIEEDTRMPQFLLRVRGRGFRLAGVASLEQDDG